MNYYNEIKNELLNNEIVKRIKDYSKNKNDLETYYKVGKILSEAGKHYGEGIIKEYSKKLTSELGRGYTQSRLRYFRRFYCVFSKCPTMSDKISFSHYCEIIWFDDSKMKYYLWLACNQNLSVRELRTRIKNKEYERLDDNTKIKVTSKKDINITDYVKNPILIKNKNNINNISEKVLQQLILEDIPTFLKELGEGFTFIDNEYKIKIGDRYNYIDNNLKTNIQDKTIGIIICKKENKYIIEYASDKRILTRRYMIF